MKITVQLFASLREAAGAGQMGLDVPSGATPRQVAQLLSERFPEIRRHLEAISFAVNGEIVPADFILSEACELALLPPVSGGSTDSLSVLFSQAGKHFNEKQQPA